MPELQRRMTMEQFVDWQAYALLEPFGGDMDFLRTGIIASTIANSTRGKNTKPYKASDFMPDFKKRWLPVKKQSVAKIKEIMLGLVEKTKPKKEQ